jgi:hypothetical protein
MPRLFSEGIAVLGMRGGVTLPLALSRSTLLLPSGGMSFVVGVGSGGGAGALGYNLGVAMVAVGTSRRGVRLGVTWHRFENTTGAVWLLEVGFVSAR